MTIHVHISHLTVEEKINYWIDQQDDEPYESGPIALRDLYEFIIDGVAHNKFDAPASVCEYVQFRIREYQEGG